MRLQNGTINFRMKKKLLFIVLFSLCLAATLFSCQGDETELASQSKVDLLMAKSKEFAKKYGVDVSLNKEYVEAHADEMTIENMEAGYRDFAEMKNNVQHIDTVLICKKTLSRKTFIKRRKVETETMTPDMLDNEGAIESEGTASSICCGNRITYRIMVLWKSDRGTIRVKLDNVTMRCNAWECNKDMRHVCPECEGKYSDDFWSDVQSGTVTKEGVSFSTSCLIKSISVCAYSFKNVSVDVSCNGSHGYVKLGL